MDGGLHRVGRRLSLFALSRIQPLAYPWVQGWRVLLLSLSSHFPASGHATVPRYAPAGDDFNNLVNLLIPRDSIQRCCPYQPSFHPDLSISR